MTEDFWIIGVEMKLVHVRCSPQLLNFLKQNQTCVLLDMMKRKHIHRESTESFMHAGLPWHKVYGPSYSDYFVRQHFQHQ